MKTVGRTTQTEGITDWAVLASALSGRDVRVQMAEPGMAAWTDGKTIYVTDTQGSLALIEQLCVQSALLAADSLSAQIIKSLLRKPDVANRYLLVEGQRALKEIQPLLPVSLRCVFATPGVFPSDSPATSLAIAKQVKWMNNPPECFGVINPDKLLASMINTSNAKPEVRHIPRSMPEKHLAELTDDAEQGEDGPDPFTSPVGGGGGIGKLLQKMLQAVRNLKAGGSPGADAPTHWSRVGSRSGIRAVQSSFTADSIEDAFGFHTGMLYPEWNVHAGCYRMDWCSVYEQNPVAGATASVEWLEEYGLRKPLSRLGMGLDRFHRQPQGDEIDIDAAVESCVEAVSGSSVDESIYVESQRHRRDLSVMILLDISGSVAQLGATGVSIHELQRNVSAALITVLHEVGDRVALYAFHSQGRSAIHLTPVKRFDDNFDSRVMSRLCNLKPGAYSRLGAAIRHGSTVLLERGGTLRKLLLVLSDGLAYDHGYEPAYAAADVRQALGEARRDGVGCLCLSVGADTDQGVLKNVFGSAAHAMIPDPKQLGRSIGPLFRAALQAADTQCRTA